MRTQHRPQSVNEIQDAFKVYEEIAKQYEDDWQRATIVDESDTLDLKLFNTLVKQVSMETMAS